MTKPKARDAADTGTVVQMEVPAAAPAASSENTSIPTASGELLSCVESAGSTITGCTENEKKNYYATADFACRQLAVALADRWKDICKTARVLGPDEVTVASKVAVGYKVDINHTNLLLHDTKVSMSFAKKFSQTAEIQEDLTQTTFKLAAQA